MQNIRLKQITLTILIIIFMIMTICNCIISFNTYHLEHCNTKKCTICNIIHIAINFMNYIKSVFFIKSILFIVVISNLIKELENNIINTSLIKLKVQHNE